MKKLIVTLLLFCAVAFFAFEPIEAATMDPYVKVGLAYGNNALPAAKLMNVSGMEEGFSFGYFDSSNEFTGLGECRDRYIAVLKDATVYMSTSEAFTDSAPSNTKKVFYPFHLQLDETFFDFEEAYDVAKDIKRVGYTAFPAYVGGEYVVRVGEFPSAAGAKNSASDYEDELGYDMSHVGGSETCYTVVSVSSGSIIFEFDDKRAFGIQPNSENTWFSGYSYCGGFEYNRVNGNDITVINVLGLHDYIKGVIAYEMNPSWNIEALKAQALCAKSYTMANLGKHKSLGFDICNTTDCQVYYGTRQQTANSNKAVDDTYGMFIKYNGKVVPAFYHASSGGYTEDAANVWGSAQGYLKGVEDKYLTQTMPYSFTITNSQIRDVLRGKGYSVSDITDYYVSEFTPYGNVRAVTFVQSGGKKLVFTGERARTIINNASMGFQVNSQRYTVTPSGGGAYVNGSPAGQLTSLYAIGGSGTSRLNKDVGSVKVLSASGVSDISTGGGTSGSYTVSGTGSGHNVGMSQWGAKAMADKGFDYKEIINFYYTDVEIGYLN